MRSLIVASPSALSLTPPAPAGMINFARDVHFAEIDQNIAPGGTTRLILKSADGENTTSYCRTILWRSATKYPAPCRSGNSTSRKSKSWPICRRAVPPSPFLSSQAKDILMFTLSARPGGRAPIHVNADFDEVVHYVRGPGAWGHCTEPGTLTWVPKGVVHHGPREDVPEGYPPGSSKRAPRCDGHPQR